MKVFQSDFSDIENYLKSSRNLKLQVLTWWMYMGVKLLSAVSTEFCGAGMMSL